MNAFCAAAGRTSNSHDGTRAGRPSTECAASPNTAVPTSTVSPAGFVAGPHSSCCRSSSSGTEVAQPPMSAVRPAPGAAFISSSASSASTTG